MELYVNDHDKEVELWMSVKDDRELMTARQIVKNKVNEIINRFKNIIKDKWVDKPVKKDADGETYWIITGGVRVEEADFAQQILHWLGLNQTELTTNSGFRLASPENRIASALMNVATRLALKMHSVLHKTDIPEEYKHMKVVGRGKTSLALEKDANTILLLTTDPVKVEWLTGKWGIKIGKVSGEVNFYSPRLKKKTQSGKMWAVEMPKLQKVTRKEYGWFEDAIRKIQDSSQWFNQDDNVYFDWKSFLQHLDSNDDMSDEYKELLINLAKFVKKHDPKSADLALDIHIENMMKDSNGNLILLDPLFSSKVFNDLFISY